MKRFKMLSALALGCLLAGSLCVLTGCGPKEDEPVDPDAAVLNFVATDGTNWDASVTIAQKTYNLSMDLNADKTLERRRSVHFGHEHGQLPLIGRFGVFSGNIYVKGVAFALFPFGIHNILLFDILVEILARCFGRRGHVNGAQDVLAFLVLFVLILQGLQRQRNHGQQSRHHNDQND